jgi:hypothetical protein
VRRSPIGTAATTGLLYQPQMIYCGATGGMKIGRGNRSTRRKYAPVPLCPPQIPRDQTRDRIRAAAVGSHRLTAWAMARPRLGALPFDDACCKATMSLAFTWKHETVQWRDLSIIVGPELFQPLKNGNDTNCVGFQVLTPGVTKSSIFWDITTCSLLRVNRRLGVTCRLRLQVEK